MNWSKYSLKVLNCSLESWWPIFDTKWHHHPNKSSLTLVENPFFKLNFFNYMTFATMFQLDSFNLKIKLWQLPIKLIRILY